MSSRGCVVWVGNINYDVTEQMLIQEFSKCGKVKSFRIVQDNQTGKPKGFGFCEFEDPECAHAAIRLLNLKDFKGRTLKVDFQEHDGSREERTKAGPRDLTAQDDIELISKSVGQLAHQQKVELLAQMKIFAQQHPLHARQLLIQNPQLAHALLHLQVSFGMVKPEDIAALQQPNSAMAPPPPPPPPPHLSRLPPVAAAPAPVANFDPQAFAAVAAQLGLTPEQQGMIVQVRARVFMM
jgi:cleavage stimulation factor subunit 2